MEVRCLTARALGSNPLLNQPLAVQSPHEKLVMGDTLNSSD
jgi:hypothetical protein